MITMEKKEMTNKTTETYQDKSGYITSEKDGKTRIDGVYNDGLAAFELDDAVFIGSKGVEGVDNPVTMTKESLNKFCIMWLAINDPLALSKDQ